MRSRKAAAGLGEFRTIWTQELLITFEPFQFHTQPSLRSRQVVLWSPFPYPRHLAVTSSMRLIQLLGHYYHYGELVLHST